LTIQAWIVSSQRGSAGDNPRNTYKVATRGQRERTSGGVRLPRDALARTVESFTQLGETSTRSSSLLGENSLVSLAGWAASVRLPEAHPPRPSNELGEAVP
jgi:hypothetical protein